MIEDTRITAAKKLISFLNSVGIRSVVCGGYARDTLLDRPIKDVDLSVPHADYHRTVDLLRQPTYNPHAEWLPADDARYVHAGICVQEEFELDGDLEFGLPTRTIHVRGQRYDVDGPGVVSHVNFGLCKAYIDAEGPRGTDDFWADVRDEQITLLRTDWGLEGSLKHFLRMQKKYPWPMRVRG